MRVADQPVPVPVGTHPTPPPWPADLFVTIERLPVYAYTWDDDDGRVVWNAPGSPAPYLWDDPAGASTSMLDATCDVQGLDVDFPAPDTSGRFTAAALTMSLANGAGQWSQYDTTGRLVYYAPGRNVKVWAQLHGAAWWLFSGEVSRWDELPDGTVSVEAVDAFSNLNQGIGQWNPGVYGDTPGARLTAIAQLVAYPGPTRFATGDVTLHSYLTTSTPLEEMQAVARSDGGVLAVDADGTLVYYDRSWPAGRTDQTTVPTLTDNVCTGPVVVWDLTLATDDELANIVGLTNLEGIYSEARSTASSARYRRRTLEHANDQWTSQAQGDTLAVALLTRQQDAQIRIESFTLYLHDPGRDLWQLGIDLRRGDRLRLVREQAAVGGLELVDVNLVVWSVRHQVTPAGWVVEVGTTRAVSANQWWRWDDPAITWDDPTDPPQWTF